MMTPVQMRNYTLAANTAQRQCPVKVELRFRDADVEATITPLGGSGARTLTLSPGLSYNEILITIQREARRQEAAADAPRMLRIVPPMKG